MCNVVPKSIHCMLFWLLEPKSKEGAPCCNIANKVIPWWSYPKYWAPKIIRGTRQICASLYSSPQVILESIIGFISIFRGNEAVAMSIICYIIFNRGEVCSMHNKTPLLTVTHDILSDDTPGNIMAVMEVDRIASQNSSLPKGFHFYAFQLLSHIRCMIYNQMSSMGSAVILHRRKFNRTIQTSHLGSHHGFTLYRKRITYLLLGKIHSDSSLGYIHRA